jgi:general secretion pathway protein D
MLAILVAVGGLGGGLGSAQDTPPAAPAPEAAEQPLGEEEAMVLNFERADIREVIHSLATALGISYTIDPRIEGQVTIRTTGKIAREDLFPLLNQILRNNGIAAVKVGDLYQIVPVAEAKTRAIVPRDAALRRTVRDEDAFVIEIIPVKHVSSDEMANILQPFITPGGDVLSYPRGNLVVVTDLRSNVERLRELVEVFDSDIFRNLRTRVFKIVHGDPEELANEILGLLAPYGVSPTGEADGGGGVYMVPLSRLNSLVVVAFDPAIFDEVARWLKMLDIPPEEGAGRQTFVYNVENAKAVDLAAVLNELFGGGAGSGPGGGVGGRVPGAPPAGVGLFGAGGVAGGRGGGAGRGGGLRSAGGGGLGGAQQAGGALGQQAAGQAGQAAGGLGGGRGGAGRIGRGAGGGGVGGAAGGAPGAAGGGARGVVLPGGRAAAQPGAPGQPAGPPPIFKEEVRIVADEVTNSLVILATKRDYNLILDVLRRIDVVPRQVLLEVTIAEVRLTRGLDFGVAYAISDRRLNRALPGDASADIFRSRGGSVGQEGARGLGGLIGTATRIPGQGAFAVISNREEFNIFLNALQGETSVKMLSAPHIMAADNREAHILVGNSIPILTSTAATNVATGTTGNVLSVNSVQYRDTGKILTILPQVNSKGLVNLQIRQEVSDVLPGQASFGNTNSPAFSTREAETTVVVQDGESVLIGGIIDDSVTHERSGVPYLMDVPVFGRLFRVESDDVIRTELLVLITPFVVLNRDEARTVTESFSERLQGLKRLGQRLRDRNLRLRQRRAVEPEETRGPQGGSKAPDVVPREAAP